MQVLVAAGSAVVLVCPVRELAASARAGLGLLAPEPPGGVGERVRVAEVAVLAAGAPVER